MAEIVRPMRFCKKWLAIAPKWAQEVGPWNIQLDDEALWSITRDDTAETIIKFIRMLPNVDNDSVITDCGASVGGMSIPFAREFRFVNAIERDIARFKMLRANMMTCRLKNVHCYLGDATKMMDKIRQDVLFIDPPWGGPAYKTSEKIVLDFGEKNIIDFVAQHSDTFFHAVLKLPLNYDLDDLYTRAKGKFIIHIMAVRNESTLIIGLSARI